MRMNRRSTVRRALATLASAGAVLALVVPAASAVTRTYATSSAPQAVTGQGSTARTYGSFVIYDRTSTTVYAGLDSWFKFSDADDHKAYNKFSVNVFNRESLDSWGGGDQSSHENVVSSSWRRFGSQAQRVFEAEVGGSTTDATAKVLTCIDVPWRVDSCSPAKTLEFDF